MEINGACSNIMIALNSGAPTTTTITWTAKDNVTVALTYVEMFTLGATIASTYGTIHRSARAEKDTVLGVATTP